MKIRRAAERGVANFGWLDSRHTFSFGQYHDPEHMGFGPLRVINDDRVQPGGGFPTHGHADMEIISYVVEGGLEHKDSIGTGSIIIPGEVQRMSAGRGIHHSEYNASHSEPVRFLQIWIQPQQPGIDPGYEQKQFFSESDAVESQFMLVGSPDGREDSITIHQDVIMYVARMREGGKQTLEIAEGRKAWVQMVKGTANVNEERLSEGDGAAIESAEKITFSATSNAEILVFDLSA